MASIGSLLLLGASLASSEPVLVHATRVAMGTVFDILAYDPSRPRAERAIADALAEVERLDAMLSDYKAESELRLAVVAARRRPVRVSPELYEVLAESLRYARISGGAFDPTVAPLVRAWKSEMPPSEIELARLRSCVGWKKLRLHTPDRIQALSDCLEVDLGGIGKGYAVDRAGAILEQAGIRSALVNAGSSTLLALDPQPGEPGWKIELPSGAGTVKLARGSLSISQQAAGHIVDPISGRPSPISWSIAVTAPTATASDALATAFAVLGPENGATVLAHLRGIKVRWIDGTGKIR